VASALVNSTQQIGGSIGTALLNTVATTVTASYIRGHGVGSLSAATGALHGYTVAFAVGAGFLALALVAVWSLVNARPAGSTGPAPDVSPATDDGFATEDATAELGVSPALA